MAEVKVTVDEKKKELTITMPLIDPKESKSGKSLTVASTFGNFQSEATIKGKRVTVGVNAYIKKD